MYLFKTSLFRTQYTFIYIQIYDLARLSMPRLQVMAYNLEQLISFGLCLQLEWHFKPGLSKVKMPRTFECHAVNSCVYVSGSSHESEC